MQVSGGTLQSSSSWTIPKNVWTRPSRLPLVVMLVKAVVLSVQVEFGVVYSCLEDKMFTARRGKGAFCNGEPLQVSEQAGEPSIHEKSMSV